MGLCLGKEKALKDHKRMRLNENSDVPFNNHGRDSLVYLQPEEPDLEGQDIMVHSVDTGYLSTKPDMPLKESSEGYLPRSPQIVHKPLNLKNSAKTIEVMRKNSKTVSEVVVELKVSPKIKHVSKIEKMPSNETLTDPLKANLPNYSPKLLKRVLPPHLKQDFQRNKSNSTSTMFINTTIKAPDEDELLKCMSVALCWNIQEPDSNVYINNVFDERVYPLSEITEHDIPSEEDVYEIVSAIFKAQSLSAECAIMCMAYVDRLVMFGGLSFNTYTWRRIVLGCIILASKVWEDQAVWNVDFIDVFPNLTLQDLGRLERCALDGLKFNVTLKSSVYTKYYFELRRLAERDAKNFPLEPLDKEGSKRLEERSKGLEESAKLKQIKRSMSVDLGKQKKTPVSIP